MDSASSQLTQDDDERFQNEIINKGFGFLVDGDSEPTASYAYRGLIKYELKQPEGETRQTKQTESKRFRRLNNTLHNMIENEILIPHRTTRGWGTSRAGHVSRESTTLSTGTRGPLSRESTTLSIQAPVNGFPPRSKSEVSGAFLEMLMEIDESTGSHTQIQE